jgi:hypothetical protein
MIGFHEIYECLTYFLIVTIFYSIKFYVYLVYDLRVFETLASSYHPAFIIYIFPVRATVELEEPYFCTAIHAPL